MNGTPFTIDVSSLLGQLNTFNPSDKELLTGKPFKELVDEKLQSKMPYFLAFIKEKNGNGNDYYSFDAITLTNRMKNETVPTNPKTKKTIKKILYFCLEPGKTAFKLVCSVKANEISDQATFIQHLLAAQSGDPKAQFTVAGMYKEGKGTEASPEEAQHFFKLAADQGHIEACYQLALHYIINSSKNGSDTLNYMKSAADKGLATAQYQLGLWFKNGILVQVNAEEAFRYTKLAADQGLPIAQYAAGLYYEKGYGVNASPAFALRYLASAASKGEGLAQHALGVKLAKNEVPSHFTLPVKTLFSYVEVAADKHQIDALFALGMALYNKEYSHSLSSADPKKNSVHYLKLAADQEHQKAQYEVSLCYKLGTRVEKSPKEAFKYMEMAATKHEKPLAKALFHLAKYYEEGVGIGISAEKAADYMERASREGLPEAFYEMGRYIYQGFGGPSDPKRGLDLIVTAAFFGNKEAEKHLAQLLLSSIEKNENDLVKTLISLIVANELWEVVKYTTNSKYYLNCLWHAVENQKNFEASQMIISSMPIKILSQLIRVSKHESSYKSIFIQKFQVSHGQKSEYTACVTKLQEADNLRYSS